MSKIKGVYKIDETKPAFISFGPSSTISNIIVVSSNVHEYTIPNNKKTWTFFNCGTLNFSDALVGDYKVDVKKIDYLIDDQNAQLKFSDKMCFRDCQNLTNIDQTIYVRDTIASSFYNCSSLTQTPPISIVGVDHDVNTVSAFANCQNIRTIDPAFNLARFNNGQATFENCSSLLEVPDTFSLKNTFMARAQMNNFFNGCYSLSSLGNTFDLPSTVYQLQYVFQDCYSLSTVNHMMTIPSTCVNSYCMFKNAKNLEHIPVVFDPHATCLEQIGDMFAGCSSLVEIPNTFVIPAVTSELLTHNMFMNCCNLETVYEDFRLPELTTECYSFFSGCNKLAKMPSALHIPAACTNTQNMFSNCISLSSIPSTFTLGSSLVKCSGMFQVCTNVEEIEGDFVIPASVSSCQDMFKGCSGFKKDIHLTYLPGSSHIDYGNEMFYNIPISTMVWVRYSEEDKYYVPARLKSDFDSWFSDTYAEQFDFEKAKSNPTQIITVRDANDED